MRALVTGAAGFLGLYIVEQLLARGDQVRAMCRRPSPELRALGVEIVVTDVRDAVATRDACADRDAVFHAAGVAGIWGPWDYYYGINTLGTRHILDGCLRYDVQKLVYTSSPSVTFDGSDQRGVDESAPYPRRWLCHYPHTKALAEQEVLAANGRERLLTCALRPHLIWGPRDRHLIPRLIERARAGQLRRVGAGRNLIDMVHVENAAQAHLQAADALGARFAGGRPGLFHQPGPAGELLGVDRPIAGIGRPAAGAAIGAVCRGLRGRSRNGSGLHARTPAGRAAHDAFPGRAVGPRSLFQYLARPA